MFQRETVEAAMAGARSEGILAEEPAVGDSRWWQRARDELADREAAAACVAQWRREFQRAAERAAADREAAE